ncbi:hypothetical protein F4819DRAFT_460441 [Hypoxylon fuscum]|nr:hypothetical protein F4819DRAFT_460441 [Hypoxylon fuscum]
MTVSSHEPPPHQTHHRPNTDDGPTLLDQGRVLLRRLYSSLDTKMTIRFTVIAFSYSLGLATMYSGYVAPDRPVGAVSSSRDDSYPIMVAQFAGSLLSPALFAIVSIRESSTTLWQKVTSLYYILLVAGVLMSLISLLLYSLWPTGYRVNNIIMIASLMFTVLGGWQSLEKDWKGAVETPQVRSDVELGIREP